MRNHGATHAAVKAAAMVEEVAKTAHRQCRWRASRSIEQHHIGLYDRYQKRLRTALTSKEISP